MIASCSLELTFDTNRQRYITSRPPRSHRPRWRPPSP
jgi:hypothetical protein